uniref:Uncharacterized protein n=1 Tax=Rhizophora mucronata TaxID=61149 RepID=A0A2P2QX71_RHIMU
MIMAMAMANKRIKRVLLNWLCMSWYHVIIFLCTGFIFVLQLTCMAMNYTCLT